MVRYESFELLDKLGFGRNIGLLEKHIESLRILRSDNLIENGELAKYEDLLKELKPTSRLLMDFSETQINLDTEDTSLLGSLNTELSNYKTYSIKEVSKIAELEEFKSLFGVEPVEFFVYTLPYGYKHRRVYEYGELVLAETYSGTNITNLITNLIGNKCEEVKDIERVEIYGEIVDKELIEIVDSLFDAKSNGLGILDYQVYCDSIGFDYMEDKFKFLNKLGFKTPDSYILDSSTDMRDIGLNAKHKGLACYINDLLVSSNIETYYGKGSSTVIIKECNKIYCGIIEALDFDINNGEIIPIAVVSEFKCLDENKYLFKDEYTSGKIRVNMYSIGIVQRCGYYKNSEIYFTYDNGFKVLSTSGKQLY